MQKNPRLSFTLSVSVLIAMLSVPGAVLAADAKVSCLSLDGEKSLGVESAVVAGLSKNSAASWYLAGKGLAEQGFANLAYFSLDRAIRARGTGAATFAALDCLDKIQSQNAILDLPSYDEKIGALAKAANSSGNQDILSRFAFRSVVQRLGMKAKPASLNVLSPALKGSGPYSSAAKGLIASAQAHWKAAKSHLSSAIGTLPMDREAEGLSVGLVKFKPILQLALARSIYSLGDDATAIAEYEKLFRIGLPMQDAIIESGWAQLRRKNYVKAIGLSYELTTGKLSDFFAPEALSIRAISFVENCRYSAAKKNIEKFSSTYTPIAAWIRESGKDDAPLYEKAIARAEGAIGADAVPDKVWSLWTGSDLFVATQKGIQKAFSESRDAPEWIASDIASPKARALFTDDLKRVEVARSRAALRIENHLEDLNASMLARINQESERLRFVRIEANQGAGRDLIYRNANPGVVDAEKKIIKADRRAKSYKGKLDWGKVNTDDPEAESWIDEVGNFEAKALDLCKAKAEYEKQGKKE